MIFARLKARIDRDTAEHMARLPLHEQDQIDEAAKTWRGTLRYIFDYWKRAARGG